MKDCLEVILEESGKTAPELYKSAGFSRQMWNYYLNNQDTLSRRVLSQVYEASGLAKDRFFDIVFSSFSQK